MAVGADASRAGLCFQSCYNVKISGFVQRVVWADLPTPSPAPSKTWQIISTSHCLVIFDNWVNLVSRRWRNGTKGALNYHQKLLAVSGTCITPQVRGQNDN